MPEQQLLFHKKGHNFNKLFDILTEGIEISLIMTNYICRAFFAFCELRASKKNRKKAHESSNEIQFLT